MRVRVVFVRGATNLGIWIGQQRIDVALAHLDLIAHAVARRLDRQVGVREDAVCGSSRDKGLLHQTEYLLNLRRADVILQ